MPKSAPFLHQLSGHRANTPAQDFADLAAWCAQHDVQHDRYGSGETIAGFEHKIATLLGFEAGLFVISGTLAQSIALGIATQSFPHPVVAMHPSCHIYLHEAQNYQLQQAFVAYPIGSPFRVWTQDDLTQCADTIHAAVYELPMREIGAQLPSWHELQQIKTYAHQNNIHLHMDGARLWECGSGYQRSYQEICQGFDSVYVSFYKGIGAFAGAMLLGSENFIAKARLEVKRRGGNVFKRSPYLLSAMMQFDSRIAAMPAYYQRTLDIAALIERHCPAIRINPATPQCNLFHLHLPFSKEAAQALNQQLVATFSFSLCNAFQHGMLANECYCECYIGDNALALDNALLIEVFDYLQAEIEKS